MGLLPFGPALVWRIRRGQGGVGRYNLEGLRAALPAASAQAEALARGAPVGKRIFIFASIHYWIEYCAMLGLSMAGQGHKVALGYFPYSDYRRRTTRFDRRLQAYYTRLTLEPAREVMPATDLSNLPGDRSLPPAVMQAVEKVSAFDTQYVLQVEQVDRTSDFYRMRLEYNTRTARALLAWLRVEKPDLLLFPNGIVIEYGVAYQVARYLDIPVVTFEFSDTREQIWMAHGDEVMRQDTDSLWEARRQVSLSKKQRQRIQDLESARRSARSFGKSERLWQDLPPQGREAARAALGLDDRPAVLLATNVLGDSLILGRDFISPSMGEWVLRTVEYFSRHSEACLLLRAHPGERLMTGPSMVDIVRSRFPQLPGNVRLIGPLEKVNTYDLMALVQLGLVYTTTTGLEMVMDGIPVIVAGSTHYRGRGFTLDPADWEEYFRMLDRFLSRPETCRPTPEQVELAWNYAYRFFFEYPRPFPWKIYKFWRDYELWPLERILGKEGQVRFGATFRSLAGEPIEWTDWRTD